ncbi:MAG: hypothetical protein BWY66_00285 [bacterium ADurb.Bin374]|nr:MAG: hypothetical protein BWY66_00285 [bacterium ADurb.Bin374]
MLPQSAIFACVEDDTKMSMMFESFIVETRSSVVRFSALGLLPRVFAWVRFPVFPMRMKVGSKVVGFNLMVSLNLSDSRNPSYVASSSCGLVVSIATSAVVCALLPASSRT